VLPARLLWDPLPDPLPVASSGPLGRIRDRVAVMSGLAVASRLPLDELVRHRVRRGAVQGLVRDAYQTAVAEQDEEHRRPREFAQAWRSHLAALIDHSGVDLSGCGPASLTGEDVDLAWELFEAASRAREDALRQVKLKRSRCPELGGGKAPIFEVAAMSQGSELGKAKYGTCDPCGTGLLYKISFDPHWQFCGLGRLVLGEIEGRHPRLTWYTTAQFKEARGFYDRYRQGSSSPWSDKQHPCPHFD